MDLPEGYVDWIAHLEEVGGPFKWVRQRRHFPKCSQYELKPRRRLPQTIIDEVLESERVKVAAAQYAARYRVPVEKAEERCRELIEAMAHEIDLTSIRCVGYFVGKVLAMVYDEIILNATQLRRLRETFKDTPIVFVPTHRTYADFLLLSIMCYDQASDIYRPIFLTHLRHMSRLIAEMTMPAIAAAMDFLNSRFIGEALRRCGAFFIKRAVGEDVLYWSIFTEYVQSHIINGDRPLEFFIEGTRSRTNKTLPPKYGLLQILLEPYLRSKVYDVVVVPVTMKYDKILEEQLYAYELLGFPKPKESTSGLLKARSILNKKFGRVTITFCPPYSIRDHLADALRITSQFYQPECNWQLEARDKAEIRAFGHQIIKTHHKYSTVSVWPIACLAMLRILDESHDRSMVMSEVVSHTRELLQLFGRFNVPLDIRLSEEEDLRRFFALHSDLFSPLDPFQSDAVFAPLELPVQHSSQLPKRVLEQALVPIILTNHSNELLSHISGQSVLAFVFEALGAHTDVTQVRYAFQWLRKLLYLEFVYDARAESFDAFLKQFADIQLISIDGESITTLDHRAIEIIASITKPSLVSFSTVLNVLSHTRPLETTEAESMADMHVHNRRVRLSFLCTESIKNAFATIRAAGGLQQRAKNHVIKLEEVQAVQSKLASLLNWTGQESGRSRL